MTTFLHIQTKLELIIPGAGQSGGRMVKSLCIFCNCQRDLLIGEAVEACRGGALND